MQQEEFPNKVAETYDPASENIKNWFEANKEVLISRNQQGSESFRTKNNFLFPYIEKEVDWTQHKTFKFKDGREVAEFPVKSEKIPIPGFLVDSVDDKSKIKIKQSVLFVKKLESTEYSPLLVRFYSLQENIDQVSYSHIPKDWNGIIEAFGMNDGHYITFNFKDGKMVSYIKIIADEAKSSKLRNENKNSVCYTYLVENPYHMVCVGGDCVTHHQGYSVRTVCITYEPSGPGGSGPGGDSFCEEFDCYAFPGTGDLGDGLDEELVLKDIENKYGRLNSCEKQVIRQSIINGDLGKVYSIYENSILADQKTTFLFGPNGGGNNLNDCGDAFRHAYWNALNVMTTIDNQLSTNFANAHECDTPSEKELEKTMDLHNNQVGRNIGQIANESNVVSLVLQALYNGELVVLDQLDQNNNILLGLSEVVSSDILCN